MSDYMYALLEMAVDESRRLMEMDEKYGAYYRIEQKSFEYGAAFVASRLTREKIAIALAKRKARDWDSMSGALHVAAIHAEYPNADAILALLVDDTQS